MRLYRTIRKTINSYTKKYLLGKVGAALGTIRSLSLLDWMMTSFLQPSPAPLIYFYGPQNNI